MRHRADPRRTAPWARTVVVCIRRYGVYRLPPQPVGHIGRNYLVDRRAEACADHGMAKAMTDGLRDLGLRVKKGGVPDRLCAVKAGVARIGRNGFAYADGCGSWINIATWRIDAEVEADAPAWESPCPPRCRACLEACPTGAITEPHVTAMQRCVAYLTYDAPHPIDPDLWEHMGPWVYGCDVCQEVCPLNRDAWIEKRPAPWLESIADLLRPERLAVMDRETYETTVHPLFWYIPREDLGRWHANARRAARAGTQP